MKLYPSIRTLVLCLALCAVALAQLPQGVTKVTSVEGITEYRLENGLRVLLFPDPTKSNITVNITYMVGSRHEDYGETGMAHLLEHLLFKGSTRHPNIPKELSDHGARPNGTTWVDRTNYFETFQASEENLRWALDLEADRMVNSFIAKKDLDSEFTVVRNEFEAGENSPQSVLNERVFSTAYLWHNYGKSTIGARSDIEQVPIERLQAFWRHFYQPDNAVLVVAGKIDEAATLRMVHQYFAPIPKPTRQLRRTYTNEPTQDGERFVVLRRNGDVQALGVGYHIPPGSHEDYVAVDMAASILGDAPSGRLYKALVETKKAANVSVDAFQFRDPGLLYASATVRMEQPLAEARRVMLEVFDELKAKPFTAEEVERARTQFLKSFDLLINNSERVALNLSEWQSLGDWRMMFLHRDRLRKVTREQIQKAAEKYFVASNRTVGEFVPDKNPVRAEIPLPPDVDALVKDYKGDALVSQGEAFDATPGNIDKRTARGDLRGGIKLSLLAKKTRGEQVVATLQIHFGNETNLNDKSFVAQLAGGMLMRGTAKHTRQQIKDEFDRLKAQVSVSGSVTAAVARVTTTRENLPAVLNLVAEILKEPAFPQSEFDQLKQQTLAGIEANKSEPQTKVLQAAQRHVTPAPKGDVRYTPTTEESIAGIQAVTVEDMKAFHKAFYGASNAEFVAIGDFDSEALQKQVGDLFNDWKSGQAFARVDRKYQKIAAAAETFETPDKANAMVIVALPVPVKDTDPDYAALLFGNYIFGGSGLNSRLFARIRGKEGLSYGVGSQFGSRPLEDVGTFLAFAICAPENAPKVEASFKDELASVLTKGFTAEEVEAAKKSWVQSRQVGRANDGELVGTLANQRFYGRTMEFDASIDAKIAALTPAQVQAAFKKYIDPAGLSFFRGGDFQKVKATF